MSSVREVRMRERLYESHVAAEGIEVHYIPGEREARGKVSAMLAVALGMAVLDLLREIQDE